MTYADYSGTFLLRFTSKQNKVIKNYPRTSSYSTTRVVTTKTEGMCFITITKKSVISFTDDVDVSNQVISRYSDWNGFSPMRCWISDVTKYPYIWNGILDTDCSQRRSPKLRPLKYDAQWTTQGVENSLIRSFVNCRQTTELIWIVNSSFERADKEEQLWYFSDLDMTYS